MNQLISAGLVSALLFASTVNAEQALTSEQILSVIEASDEAAMNRDTEGIGVHLADDFVKYIDIPSDELPVTIRLDKPQYLELIDKGWLSIENYSYERSDVTITLNIDGKHGESKSTIVENMTVNGKPMVSKVREYATYTIEGGSPKILMVEGHTLVGDTTPE